VKPGEITTGIDWVLDLKPTYLPQVNRLAAVSTYLGPAGNISSMALSPDGSRIAFAMDVAGNFEIFVMQSDGSQVTQLTNHPGLDLLPSWSPNGQKLVFARTRQDFSGIDIYVMDANGGNQTLLADNGDNPRWAPNGRQISFERPAGAGLLGLYVLDANGRNLRNLTNNIGDRSAAWSPDSSKLVFQRYDPQTGSQDLYAIHADGSQLTRLTNAEGTEIHPRWSPDGARLVFVRYFPSNGQQRIYLLNADGSNEVRLTNHEGRGSESSPIWSPDGSRIAFARYNGYSTVLNTVEAAANSRPFTFSLLPSASSSYEWPAWSPDGESIYFLVNDSSGNRQIAVVAAPEPPGSR
jgi:TolB protein